MLQEGRPTKAIAEALGRAIPSIRSRIITLKLSKSKPAQLRAPRGDAGADDEEEVKDMSSIAALPGVRIITHRMRG